MTTDHLDDHHAVVTHHAESGTDAWRSAVRTLPAGAPDHSTMYRLAGEAVDTLRCLADLAGLVTAHAEWYGAGRVLRDDEAGHDPADRLAGASSWAMQLQRDLAYAERSADRFWSEIGHIAVEDVIA